MRALAFGLLVMMFPAALGACAVDATSPISEEDRTEVARGVGASNGASSPPVESGGAQTEPVRTVQSHKAASTTADPGLGPTSEPQPEPWKSGGGPGKGAQKNDGFGHTKMRDPLKPDDGKDP